MYIAMSIDAPRPNIVIRNPAHLFAHLISRHNEAGITGDYKRSSHVMKT